MSEIRPHRNDRIIQNGKRVDKRRKEGRVMQKRSEMDAAMRFLSALSKSYDIKVSGDL